MTTRQVTPDADISFFHDFMPRRLVGDISSCVPCGVNSQGAASVWKTTRFLKQPEHAFLTRLISISSACVIYAVLIAG